MIDEREDQLTGANVARLRKEKGLSQTALAEVMREQGHDWHQNTVSRIENGRQSLSVGEVRHLGRILGGNVLAGTALGKSMSELASTLTDAAIANGLREAVAALAKAMEALTDVQELIEDRNRASHG